MASALIACGLLFGGAVQAASIYVSPGVPDISVGDIVWDYGNEYGGGRSDSTGAGDYRLFSAATIAATFSYRDPSDTQSTIYLPSLQFLVGVDAARGIDPAALGANTVDGTNNLIISGRFSPFFGPVVDLLTATVSLLKDPVDNPDSLQFVAQVTGGSLAGDYGGLGAEFVIFANAAGIGGPWTGAAFNLDSGSADFATELVPAPGSVALLLLGIAAMRRRLAMPGRAQ